MKTDRRNFLIGGLFAASAGIAYARKPQERIDYLGSEKLDSLVPTKVGRWEFATRSGLVVPPEDQLSDALYSQLLTRTYTDGLGAPVMLLIAQSAGQTGILQIHRPEVCYPVGGFSLSPVTTEQVASPAGVIPINRLTATADGRIEHILYWTRVGDAMPSSWAEQRWAVASDNLKGLIPDAVLVRISTVDPDEKAAFARLNEFVKALSGSLPANKRKVLIA